MYLRIFSATYRLHERVKKRQYSERICEIEHGTFSLLFFRWPVEWLKRPQFFIRGSLLYFQKNGNNLIVWRWAGRSAPWVSPCYGHHSSASGALVQLYTDQCDVSQWMWSNQRPISLNNELPISFRTFCLCNHIIILFNCSFPFFCISGWKQFSVATGDSRSAAKRGVEKPAWRHHGRPSGDWEDPSSTKGTVLLAWIPQWHPGMVQKLCTLCIS